MESKRTSQPIIEATIGAAADQAGNGLAYVSVQSRSSRKLLRVPFSVRRYTALEDREIAYAATQAAAERLRELGCTRVALGIGDVRLVDDLREHRDVPMPLSIPYVKLGCALNKFSEFHLRSGGSTAEDLTARARAELILHVAA